MNIKTTYLLEREHILVSKDNFKRCFIWFLIRKLYQTASQQHFSNINLGIRHAVGNGLKINNGL